ncbi:hypothetical protein GE115_00350 [Agromyces sp. CFH 90414]|uniref:Uncharacterized protein n=1 Tax=Agromyces agglutinans TaxID=2662258 RepID=A0A6I2F1J6_9MICO|nr:hypothetical protein [Agromyces agglutinans]
MLPFLIVGGIGLALLLVSLVIGDVLDHLGVGDGALSGTALAVGLVVFGASGAVVASTGLDLIWAYVLSIALAIVAYVVSVLAIRSLTRSSDGIPASAVGLTGVTTSPVTAESGEVRLDGPGEVERRLAFAETPLAAGIRIRVVAQAGARVKVAAD